MRRIFFLAIDRHNYGAPAVRWFSPDLSPEASGGAVAVVENLLGAVSIWRTHDGRHVLLRSHHAAVELHPLQALALLGADAFEPDFFEEWAS